MIQNVHLIFNHFLLFCLFVLLLFGGVYFGSKSLLPTILHAYFTAGPQKVSSHFHL